jgi:hypothetical protein
MASQSRPGETVRQMLDYLVWVSQDLQQLGAVPPPELETARRRVGAAFTALVNPMLPGYGDPYPPDVPPARSPGTWPDVAAAEIPGMTVRHQLVVIGMLADQSRAGLGARARPELLTDLEARIARARGALDRGPNRPMPPEARTRPSPALLDAAAAEQKAIREHTKRRNRQVRDMLKRRSRARRPGKKPAKRPAKAKRGGKPRKR